MTGATTGSIDAVLQDVVDGGDAVGLVAGVTTADRTTYLGAAGRRGADQDAAMTTDTVFWLASMTKAVTTVAALQQVEAGRLALDEPIAPVLPELADPQVLVGFDADTDEPVLRPAARPITLRHLLTHTSGFAYDFLNADIIAFMTKRGIPGVGTCERAALSTPLVADPGDRWEYGIGIDWAGLAVEAVTGDRLEAVLRRSVFDPLGMSDTSFHLGSDQRSRLASMHARLPDGTLTAVPFAMPEDPEFYMGGGGLYGTVGDYLRFCRMWLGAGRAEGARVLSPETVKEALRDQIGPLAVPPFRTAMADLIADAEFFPGMRKGWGLSFMITTEDAPGRRAAGSVSWLGLGNTYYWIDPARGIAGVLATQSLPCADEKAVGVVDAFERAVYADRA